MTASARKYGELVLYVAQACKDHQLFGTIKLNKILFFSDVAAYHRFGKTLTGTHYTKEIFGPVPEGIDEVVSQLEASRRVTPVERPMPDGTMQHRITPLPGARVDMTLLPAAERVLVDEVIDWMRPMSANDVSDLSHQSLGWELAYQGERIPLSTTLIPLEQRPLSGDERKRATEAAASITP